MSSVVLVTGVSRYLGARIAARLSDEPSVARIIGVDSAPPHPAFDLGRTEHVRADVRHPLLARVLDQAGVDTVVHPGIAQPPAPGEQHSTGAAALLAACERARTLTRLVAGSSTEVYGASRRGPAVFTEGMAAAAEPTPGAGREAARVETHLRTFARHRRSVAVSTLRLANVLGPTADTWLTRYLTAPVVPSVLGFDPRLQVLHEHDAAEAIVHLAVGQRCAGAVNVAGDGVLTLSRLLLIARRLRVPVPAAVIAAARLAPPSGRALLRYGRVVDTTRLTTEVGYRPRYTSAQTVHSFTESRSGTALGGTVRGLTGLAVSGAERLVGAGGAP